MTSNYTSGGKANKLWKEPKTFLFFSFLGGGDGMGMESPVKVRSEGQQHCVYS